MVRGLASGFASKWKRNTNSCCAKPHRFNDALNVFGGNFTVESDKHALVDIVLGLYAFSFVLAMAQNNLLMDSEDVGRRPPSRQELVGS